MDSIEIRPITDVKLDGYDPRPRLMLEAALKQANAMAAEPGECETIEGSKAYLRKQCHVADTTLVTQAAMGDVKAAIAVREGAHGKVGSDAVNVAVQINNTTKIERVIVDSAGVEITNDNTSD